MGKKATSKVFGLKIQILAILILGIIAGYIAARYDLHEQIIGILSQYERFELDDIFLVGIISLIFILALLSWRYKKRNDALKKKLEITGRTINDSQSPVAINLLTEIPIDLTHIPTSLIEAQEAERKRLSFELHDSVGQMLNVAKLILGRLKDKLHAQDDKIELNNAMDKIQNSINDIRKICTNIRPTILDDVGLNAALISLIDDFSLANPDINISLKVSINEHNINQEQKIKIYRIVQELLNNAITHSKSNIVEISLSSEQDQITLNIRDEGIGFDLQSALKNENSIGLKSVYHRVKSLGGNELIINSRKGLGTEISVSWLNM